MSCLPSTVPVVDTSSFTSEEVIEAAIKQLLEKRRLLDASIEVFQKRLCYIRCLSESVSPEQYAYTQACAFPSPFCGKMSVMAILQQLLWVHAQPTQNRDRKSVV